MNRETRVCWENKAELLRRQTHHDPVRDQRRSRRALPGPAELGRARVSTQPRLLRRARPGRHFAAWEQPQLFSEEMRAAFRTLRERDAGEMTGTADTVASKAETSTSFCPLKQIDAAC